MRSGSSGGALGAPSSPGFARTVSQTELGGVGGSGSSLSSLGEDAGRAGVPSRVPKRRGAGSEGAPAFRGRLAFLALASLFALAWLWFVHRAAAPSYVVVIDAGSQGSRVHVYTLDVPAIGMPSVRGEARVLRVKPGLSAFADDPIAAGASLEPLLEHAASFVPADALASTPALLYATAGLRSVPTDRAERVLASCRETLRRSPFRFRERDAMILPGEREGLYAWVAANYAAGTLGAAPANTVGVLELGGASMQITFRPERKPPEAFRVELLAARRKWSVYTHSALGLGQETARAAHLDAIAAKRRPSNVGEGEGGGRGAPRRTGGETAAEAETAAETEAETAAEGPAARRDYAVDADPCAPKDAAVFSFSSDDRSRSRSFRGGGNFTACREPLARLLGVGAACAYSRCGPRGAFLPPLRGTFVATENFHHAASFFFGAEAAGTATVADLEAAGEAHCGADLATLRDRHPDADDETLAKYCFASAFVVATLRDALGVGAGVEGVPESAVKFGEAVNGVAVDWALGAAIAYAAEEGTGGDETEEAGAREGEGEIDARGRGRAASGGGGRRSGGTRSPASGSSRAWTTARAARGWRSRRAAAVLAALERLWALARRLLFGGGAASAATGGLRRAGSASASLRLGELRVRRFVGMPSKGGVTSPSRNGADRAYARWGLAARVDDRKGH